MENQEKKLLMPGANMTNKKMPSPNMTNKIMPGAGMTKKVTDSKITMPSAEMDNKYLPSAGNAQGFGVSEKKLSKSEMPAFKMSKQKIQLSSLVERKTISKGQGKVIVPLFKGVSGDYSKIIAPVHKDVSGAPASPLLTYGNGPLLTNVQVITIFWGAAWNQAPQNNLLTQLNQFFDFILTSSLIDLLGEYSVPGKTIGHGSRIATITDSGSEPGGGSGHVSDVQLQQEILRLINNGSVPSANANTLYFVYLPPNVTLTGAADAGGGTSCIDFCGYHWFITGTNPEIFYAAMPFPNCNGCLGGLSQIQALTSVSSHELCEAITDPGYPSGWNNTSVGEIGDICAWQTAVIGNFTIQKEWSNAQGICAIAPASTQPSGWSGWDSLSGWIDMLTVGRNLDGRLEVFARGGDGAVWHNWQTAPNNGWSGWDSLGGWIDMLTVAQNSDGRLELFARGGDGAVWHNWQTTPNGGWSGWDSLGGWIDMLAVGRNLDGRLEIFARGGDGAVWHNWQTAPNSGWSGWDSLGGWIDILAVGQNQDGRLEVFARGGDGAVWHNWQTAPNSGWSGWDSLGGWIDRLSIAENADGRLEIFARGADAALWHNWQTAPNNGWSGWDSLGGWIDLLTVGGNQDGRLEVFARGGDGAVWHNWQTAPNNGWSGWDSLGGWIDRISVAGNADGRLEIFARGADAALWHNWQTAPNF